MVQVYTGLGKGKTTASLGLAARAVGHGLKVSIVQFMKGSIDYGELDSMKKLGVDVLQFGRPDFVNPKCLDPIDIELANDAFRELIRITQSGNYDLVIADEINVAVHFGLIKEQDVLRVIASKSKKTELVLTGRYASDKIMEIADLVTEMKEIKHYYNTIGLGARKGIEF